MYVISIYVPRISSVPSHSYFYINKSARQKRDRSALNTKIESLYDTLPSKYLHARLTISTPRLTFVLAARGARSSAGGHDGESVIVGRRGSIARMQSTLR